MFILTWKQWDSPLSFRYCYGQKKMRWSTLKKKSAVYKMKSSLSQRYILIMWPCVLYASFTCINSVLLLFLTSDSYLFHLLIQEKETAFERYKEAYVELSDTKGRTQLEVDGLYEHLRLTNAAVQEGARKNWPSVEDRALRAKAASQSKMLNNNICCCDRTLKIKLLNLKITMKTVMIK